MGLRTMAMEKTSSRVAMALMCGLAICCAIMYITADGSDVVLAAERPAAKSVYGIGGPTSVDSQDVQKAGTIFTNTPDGRMRLTDNLTNVEKEIAAEEAARKRDVAAVKAQMARNFAFNQAARAKLQKAMLAKMAANAKKAKDDLAHAMKFVQAKFAAAADLQNKRNKANIRRSRKLRKTIRKNKALAAKNLAHQVSVQQRSMAALASAVNSRIDQTNKHVAINAAQISENAKKARAALDAAVSLFDKKVANARAEAAAGRGKLAAEAALRDQQYAKTVSDIAAAKKEAKDRVDAANTQFKTSLFTLTATVNEQVQKTNARIDQLSATVQKNKVAQAKINANVAAETKRMINLGNKRYEEGLKKDAELKSLIDSNKAATDARMQAMAAHYTMELNAVRATMKKNRAHASHMLAKKTSALYSTIEANERSQMKTNGKLKTQTREAVMEISNSLREAKDDFAKRLTALHTVVVNNDKKFESKMDKLTGIVRANAIKNKKGR